MHGQVIRLCLGETIRAIQHCLTLTLDFKRMCLVLQLVLRKPNVSSLCNQTIPKLPHGNSKLNCDSDECFWSTTSLRFELHGTTTRHSPHLSLTVVFSPFCRFPVDHYYESPKLFNTMPQNATSPRMSSSPKLCQIYTDRTTLCRRPRRARRLHNYAVTKWFLHYQVEFPFSYHPVFFFCWSVCSKPISVWPLIKLMQADWK